MIAILFGLLCLTISILYQISYNKDKIFPCLLLIAISIGIVYDLLVLNFDKNLLVYLLINIFLFFIGSIALLLY